MSYITKLCVHYRRNNRIVKKVTLVLIILFLFYIILQKVFTWSGTGEKVVFCHHSDSDVRNLLELATGVNQTLHGLKLTYFLCYGALWAAVDKSRVYKWQDTLEFCAINEEVSKLDEVLFKRQFDSYGLEISYIDRHGYYVVKDKVKQSAMEAHVILFERFTEESLGKDEMRRIGWEHRIMPAIKGYDTMDTFPLWIIDEPLNGVKLNGLSFPAPRGGIEINKYLQPDTWWKDQTPLQCRIKKL